MVILTKRDREILQFINSVGWCVAPQIGRRFGMKWWIVYRVMKKLIEAGLVIHERIRFETHGIYYLTSDGAAYTDLPVIDRVAKGIFDHQRILADVVIRLNELYPDAVWISERHLRQDKFVDGVGKRGHIADGFLIFSTNHQVALEVELSVKGKDRLKGILRFYTTQLAIKEIWYFCSKPALHQLYELTQNKSRFKIHALEEFLV